MMGAESMRTSASSGRSRKSNGSIRHAAFEAYGYYSFPITRDRILRRASAAAGEWPRHMPRSGPTLRPDGHVWRSEEHTSELQSHLNLVCRLLLEKKKIHEHHGRR